MRGELLNILRCPLCTGYLQLNEIIKDNVGIDEIRKGTIICAECHSQFIIDEGVVNLMVNPVECTKQEQEENLTHLKRKRSNKSDEWLLRLPLAEDFGNEKTGNEGILRNVVAAIDRLNLGQGAKFLDVGAGTCWATAILARRGMYSVALDITSEKYIGLCSADTFMKAYGIYFERVLSDMTRLPFADNSFDVVFSSAALHHSHRIERTFAEIGRVLKRNSRLVMVNETPRGIFEPRIVDIAKAKSRGWDAASSWHEFKYTSLEYVAFASKAGLSLKFFTSPEFDLILDGKLDVTASLNRVQRTLLKFLNLIFCRWEARLFRNLLFYLMLPLVRTPCIMIATKRGAPPMEY